MTAADSLLVPLQCEFLALEGLSQLLRTVDLVRGALNPELEIQGVVLTMFDFKTVGVCRRKIATSRNISQHQGPPGGCKYSKYPKADFNRLDTQIVQRLALRTAMGARNIRFEHWNTLLGAVWRRFLAQPRSFLLPPDRKSVV